MEREVAWNHYSEEEKKKVFEFAEEYRKFISACKTCLLYTSPSPRD